MSIERLPDEDQLTWTHEREPPCLHPEHSPPNHIVLAPGRYRYTCPGCRKSTTFVVDGPTWVAL